MCFDFLRGWRNFPRRKGWAKWLMDEVYKEAGGKGVGKSIEVYIRGKVFLYRVRFDKTPTGVNITSIKRRGG